MQMPNAPTNAMIGRRALETLLLPHKAYNS
jgi:hypothetical protein